MTGSELSSSSELGAVLEAPSAEGVCCCRSTVPLRPRRVSTEGCSLVSVDAPLLLEVGDLVDFPGAAFTTGHFAFLTPWLSG